MLDTTDTLVFTNALIGIGLAGFKAIIDNQNVTRQFIGIGVSSVLLALMSVAGLDTLARPMSFLMLLVVGYDTIPTILKYVRTFL